VMRRVETSESHVGEVPLELFQGEAFKDKHYLERTVEIIFQGVKALNVSKDELIHICSGYILSTARDALKDKGYKVIQKKIAGATQELAERAFIRSLVRIGVGDEDEVVEMRSFDSFLDWVHADLEGRERFVKTGWSAWPRLKREGRTG
jgi:hypothetical protein